MDFVQKQTISLKSQNSSDEKLRYVHVSLLQLILTNSNFLEQLKANIVLCTYTRISQLIS